MPEAVIKGSGAAVERRIFGSFDYVRGFHDRGYQFVPSLIGFAEREGSNK